VICGFFLHGRNNSEQSQKKSKTLVGVLGKMRQPKRPLNRLLNLSLAQPGKAMFRNLGKRMKRTTEVTYETEELIAVKLRRGFTGFCDQCNAFVEMLPTEAAALLTGLGEREIFRLIETGEIHFVEAERVFVCRDSPVFDEFGKGADQRIATGMEWRFSSQLAQQAKEKNHETD
jgi:hypothetical protein